MLSPQAGAVLLKTFLSMHKKCFNYFELNWKFICKRVTFRKYQHCLSPNGEWILSFKKKEKKKTPQSALTCVAGGIRVDVFPFFSRLIAATQAISVSNHCLQILSSRTALTNSKFNFFPQSFRVQFFGRRTSTALGVSAAPSTVLTLFTYKS